jgi:deazaflavin-dependent oxidoreductase (nitroreductase family)
VKDAPASRTQGPNLSWLRSKPTGASRLAFRLPIYLYRRDLGWLLGHRFLLLVHKGRESGLLRETILEVILYDPATRESVVLAAWGEKADWYRNIWAVPALEVRTGGQRYVPEQRFLAPEENHIIICDYGRRHPLAFRVFARMFGYPLDGTETARREFACSLRLVAFRPRNPEFSPYPAASRRLRAHVKARSAAGHERGFAASVYSYSGVVRAVGSQLRKLVACPAHGLDVTGVLGVWLYLVTDVLDVDIGCPRLAEEVAAPEMGHDLLAGVDPPRLGG